MIRPTLLSQLLVAGFALGLLGAEPAHASSVFRCPEAGSYSDKPCAGGRPLMPRPAPTAHQQAEAAQVAQREQALASRLRTERLAEQRAYRPLSAAGIIDSAAQARRSADAKLAAAREKAAAKQNKRSGQRKRGGQRTG